MAGTTDLSGDKVAQFRFDMFKECGFSDDAARLLVDARGLNGFKLNHHDVRRYLAQGATHDLILAIFI